MRNPKDVTEDKLAEVLPTRDHDYAPEIRRDIEKRLARQFEHKGAFRIYGFDVAARVLGLNTWLTPSGVDPRFREAYSARVLYADTDGVMVFDFAGK